MGIIERIKGQPEATPTVPPTVDVSVDAGSRLYRDPSGKKLGGGPNEGANYRSTMAENAIQSVLEYDELQTKAAEAKAEARKQAEKAKV